VSELETLIIGTAGDIVMEGPGDSSFDPSVSVPKTIFGIEGRELLGAGASSVTSSTPEKLNFGI
jgi:hypothetical protein